MSEIDDKAIVGLALQHGFMISNQYGQGEGKIMPVTDHGTLISFSRELIKIGQAQNDIAQSLADALEEMIRAFESVPDDAFGYAEDGSGDERGPNIWPIARELEANAKYALSKYKGE